MAFLQYTTTILNTLTSGQAKEKAIALSVAVGTGYSYETTFEKEVYSDLYGERGVLMGGIRASLLPFGFANDR